MSVQLTYLTCPRVNRARLTILIAVPPCSYAAAPAGEESHQSSYSSEIKPADLNEFPNCFNNPQVINRIEAAFGRGSVGNY